MDSVDVEAIKSARKHMRQTLALAHEKLLLSTYERLQQNDGVYQITPEAMAQRNLRNVCLGYLAGLEKAKHLELAHHQLQNATNMTDEIAALSCVTHNENEGRTKALEGFASKWEKDLLVMNK